MNAHWVQFGVSAGYSDTSQFSEQTTQTGNEGEVNTEKVERAENDIKRNRFRKSQSQ